MTDTTTFALAFAIIGVGAIAVLAACNPTTIQTVSQGVAVSTELPRGVTAFADPITGCEYLAYYDKGITPRYEGTAGFSYRVKGCKP